MEGNALVTPLCRFARGVTSLPSSWFTTVMVKPCSIAIWPSGWIRITPSMGCNRMAVPCTRFCIPGSRKWPLITLTRCEKFSRMAHTSSAACVLAV